jgi:hypothetical protein
MQRARPPQLTVTLGDRPCSLGDRSVPEAGGWEKRSCQRRGSCQSTSRWRWLPRTEKKKMPAADLSGCHCGCRWWWGRDCHFLPGLRGLTCLASRIAGVRLEGGMRSGASASRCGPQGADADARRSSPSRVREVRGNRLGAQGAPPPPRAPRLSSRRTLCSDLRPFPTPSPLPWQLSRSP